MKIDSSVISMSAKTSLIESHTREESLRMWISDERPDFSRKFPASGQRLLPAVHMPLPSGNARWSPDGAALPFEDTLDLSEEGKKLSAAKDKTAAGLVEDSSEITLELSERDKQKILMLQKLIEALTGKKIKSCVPHKIKLKKPVCNPLFYEKAYAVQPKSPQPQAKQGWGLEYDYHESHYKKQALSFCSEGVVKTADGREIRFSLELNMSREFASRQDISIRAGDAIRKDPLVIHFDGAAPDLTDTKFIFDLDCDGAKDQISFVAPGSGFLALDLNGDGIVNDGSELFGPKSGDGFGDLAAYDSDGNNWIDENDPIYDKLRIWTKDPEGNDVLFALGQKGIGAIYLGNAASSFDLKDGSNRLQGTIRKTGIFLREDRAAGIIQHIDLAI